MTKSTTKIYNMGKEEVKVVGAGSLTLKHVGMQIVSGGSAGCVEVTCYIV